MVLDLINDAPRPLDGLVPMPADAETVDRSAERTVTSAHAQLKTVDRIYVI